MATYTSNLNLKKPESTDTINIADLNGNMDILDKAELIDTAQTITAVKTFTAKPIFSAGVTVGVGSIADSGSDTVISSTGAVKVSQSGGTASPIMDLTNAQTVSGVKTYTAIPIIQRANPVCQIKNPSITRGTAPSATAYNSVSMRDTSGNVIGELLHKRTTDGTITTEINAYYDADTQANLVTAFTSAGKKYATAPIRRDSSDNVDYTNAIDTEIMTKAHIASITDLVHTTGAENIAGVKTFTNAIYGSAISCQVDFKGSGAAGKYREIVKIPKTVLTQVRQHLVFAITSRVRSRGIDIFSVYCSGTTPGSITLCLRSNSDNITYVLSHDSDYMYLSLYCYGDTRDAPQGGIIFCTIGQEYIENLTTYPLTDELTGTEVGRLTP